MMKKILQFSVITLILMLVFKVSAHAADPVEGKWLNEEKTAQVNIYLAKDGHFYGKIVWLSEPNRDGKPKLDKENKDAKLRTRAVMDLLMLKGFNKDGNQYVDGTIYDPKNGKTYSCKMTLSGNTLSIRGYIGISLIGRTTQWTRV